MSKPMKNNYDIENEKYAEVRQILQNLPFVKAPENFETELKAKINSLPVAGQKKTIINFYFQRALIPAAAFVLTAIVLFFIVNNKPGEDYINPFNINPPLISDRSGLSRLNSPFNVSSNDVILRNENTVRENAPAAVSTNNINAEANTAYRNRIREFLAEHQGDNVDRSLRALPGSSSIGGSRSSTVNFGGFNIIQEDDKTMDELRARMDSIKRWMRETDRR